jgi:hypothetical protein
MYSIRHRGPDRYIHVVTLYHIDSYGRRRRVAAYLIGLERFSSNTVRGMAFQRYEMTGAVCIVRSKKWYVR